MQIRGDYISYSNRNYDRNHTHHITQCQHEEHHKQKEGSLAGAKSETLSIQNAREETKQEPANLYEDARRLTGEDKKGVGFFKGIWEAMGDETSDSRPESSLTERSRISTRIMEAASAVAKHMIPYRMIGSLVNFREKIKTTARGALKLLGARGETFTALTDPREHFTGKKDAEKRFQENKEKGTRTRDGAILSAAAPDNHLMDSYSKTGAYCRLNENLTYQKKEASARPGKEAAKDE